MTEPSPAAFTEARARDVLAAAGHPEAAADAALLSLGENAVFALGGNGPVVRVGRSAELLERAERELRVAQWLAAEGVPAVRAAEPVATLVDGHPVTYWRRLPEAVRPAGPGDLAALLKLVHALPEPPFALPGVNCSAGSSAGCGWPARPCRRRTRSICAGGGMPSRRPPRPWSRICRAAPSTATRWPAMCMSGPTDPCWSTWKPSPPICGNTIWS